MKKIFLSFISLCVFSSCSPDNHYSNKPPSNKFELYEYISKIKLPNDFKLIASADSNYFSMTILQFSKNDCMAFYKAHKFSTFKDTLILDDPTSILKGPFMSASDSLYGLQYLDSANRQLPDKKKLLRLKGKSHPVKWMYLIDTTTCKLYIHFSFARNDGSTK